MTPAQLVGLLMLSLAALCLIAIAVSAVGWKAGISTVAGAIVAAAWIAIGAFLLTGGK